MAKAPYIPPRTEDINQLQDGMYDAITEQGVQSYEQASELFGNNPNFDKKAWDFAVNEAKATQLAVETSGVTPQEIKANELNQKAFEKQQQLDITNRLKQLAMDSEKGAEAARNGDIEGLLKQYAQEAGANVSTPEAQYAINNRDRSVSEVIQDTANSVARWGINTAQIITGSELAASLSEAVNNPAGSQFGGAYASISNLSTPEEKAAEQVRRFRQAKEAHDSLNDVRDTLMDSRSKPLRVRSDLAEKQLKDKQAQRKAEADKKKASGEWTSGDTAIGIITEFADTMQIYGSQPSLAVDMALENAPDILMGAGMGALIKKAAGKGVSKKTVAALAEAASVATSVVQEGASNANQVMDQILNTDPATGGYTDQQLLTSSPSYRDMVANGVSPEQARKNLAEQAYAATFIGTGILSGLASKMTGAAQFEGTLFTRGSKLGDSLWNSMTKVVADTAKETAEETIQEGVGQAVQNIAIQQTADETQSVSEGVGAGAAQGALAGGLSGGTLTAAAEVGNVNQTVKEVVQDKIAERAESQAQAEAIAEPQNAEDAVAATQQAVADADLEQADAQVDEATQEAQEEVEAIPELTPEQKAQANNIIGEYAGYVQQFKEAIANPESSPEELQGTAFNMFAHVASVQQVAEQQPELKPVVDKYVELITQEGSYINTVDSILRVNNEDKAILIDLVQGAALNEEDVTAANTALLEEDRTKVQNLVSKVLYSQMTDENLGSGFTATEIDQTADLLEQYTPEATAQVQQMRQYAEAKRLAEVAVEVTEGQTQEFRGARIHLQDIAQAVANDDTQAAQDSMARLDNFQQSQINKNDWLEQAIATRQSEIDRGVPEDQQVPLENTTRQSAASGSGYLEVARGAKGLNAAKKLKRQVEQEVGILEGVVSQANALIQGETDGTTVTDITDSDTTTVQGEVTDGESGVSDTTDTEPSPSGTGTGQLDLLTGEPDVEAPVEAGEITEPVREATPAEQELAGQQTLDFDAEPEVTTEEEVEEEVEPLPFGEPLDTTVDEESGQLSFLEQPEVETEPQTVIDQLWGEEPTQEDIDALVQASGTRTQNVAKKNALNPDGSLKDGIFTVVGKTGKTLYRKTVEGVKLTATTARSQLVNRVKEYFQVRTDDRVNALAKIGGMDVLLEEDGSEIQKLIKEQGINEIVGYPDDYLWKEYLPRFRKAVQATLQKRIDKRTKQLQENPNWKNLLYKEPLLQLVDQSGLLPQEVVDAFAITAMNTIAYDGRGFEVTSEFELKRMLGLDTKAQLPAGAMELLQGKGAFQTTLRSGIGQEVMNALGLEGKSDAPRDYALKYRDAFGAEILSILSDLGMVERYEISGSELSRIKNAQWGTADSVGDAYIPDAITYGLPENITPELQEIMTLGERSNGISRQLVDKRSVINRISFSPLEEQSDTFMGSRTKVTQRLKKANKIAQSNAQRLQQPMLNLMNQMDKWDFLEMFGWQDIYKESPRSKPDAKREIGNTRNLRKAKSVDGKNKQLERAYDSLMALTERMKDNGITDFASVDLFTGYEFATNNRQFQKSDVSNQREKLHRAFMGAGDLLGHVQNPNKSRPHRDFMIAVAQGLDLDPDKKGNKQARDAANEKLDEPEYKAVIDMLRAWDKGGSLDTQMLSDLVKKFKGEPEHAMQTLVEYARYQNFLADGSKGDQFQHSLTFEIDGVTNGPFNALLQIGTSVSNQFRQQMANGGLFMGMANASYNILRGELGNRLDNYFTVARIANGLLKQNKSAAQMSYEYNSSHEVKQAIDYLWAVRAPSLAAFYGGHYDTKSGEFKRNATKNRTTTITYGSSEGANNRKGTEEIHSEMLNQADELLTRLLSGGDPIFSDLESFVRNVNNAINATRTGISRKGNPYAMDFDENSSFRMPTNREEAIEFLTNFELNDKQLYAMQYNYTQTFGNALSGAINEYYKDFIPVKDNMIMASNMAHGLYTQAFRERHEQVRQEQIDAGIIPSDGDVSTETMNQIIKELKAGSPTYRMMMSDAGDLDTYYNTAELKWDKDAPKLGGGVELRTTDGSRIQNDRGLGFSEMGVKILPMMTISMDASMQAINYLLDPMGKALNVFDAVLGRTSRLGTASTAINKAAFLPHREWKLVQSVSDTFNRVLANNPIFADPNLTDEQKGKKLLLGLMGGDVAAYNAEMKKGFYSGLTSIAEFNPNIKAILPYINPYAKDPSVLVRLIPQLSKTLANQGQAASERVDAATSNGTFNQMGGVDKGGLTITNGRVQEKTANDILVNNRNTGDINELKYVERSFELDASWFDNAHAWLSSNTSEMGAFVQTIFAKHKDFLAGLDYAEVDKIDKAGNVRGFYKNGKIVVQSGLTNEERIAVIAHEAVHAIMEAPLRTYLSGNTDGLTQLELEGARLLVAHMDGAAKEYDQLSKPLQNAIDLYQSGSRYEGMQEFIAESLTEEASMKYMKTRLGTVAKGFRTIAKYADKVFLAVCKFLNLKGDTEQTGYSDLAAVVHAVDNPRVVNTSSTLYSETANDQMTVNQLFEQLRQGTERDDLRGALEHIQDRIVSLVEAREPEIANVRNATEQVFVDALSPEVVQNYTSVVESGFDMSEQEALVFQLYTESTLAALQGGYHNATTLRRFYDAARKQIKPSVFMDSSIDEDSIHYAQELTSATEKWNSIFRPTGDASTYLANFAALAVTNQEMQGLLRNVAATEEIGKRTPLTAKIRIWVEQAIDKLNQKLLGKGDTPTRVALLARRINAVKARKENAIIQAQNGLNSAFSKTDDVIRTNVTRIASAIRGSRWGDENKTIGYTGTLARAFSVFAGSDGPTENNFLAKHFYDKAITGKVFVTKDGLQNEVGNMINEITGGTTGLKRVRDLKRKKVQDVDTRSQHIRDAIPADIQKNANIEDAETDAAIQRSVVQIDLSSLLEGDFAVSQIQELAANVESLQTAIDEMERQVSGLAENEATATYYLNQSEHLGKYLVTGDLYISGQMPNALAIAEKLGWQPAVGSMDGNPLVSKIDQLASLYALKNSTESDKEVLASHDTNGLKWLMTKYNALKNQEKNAVSGNGAYSQTKGFTFDVNDPKKAYKVVRESEVKKLERKGFQRVPGFVPKDAADNGERLVAMQSEEGGNIPFLQGALSIIDNNVGGINPFTGQPIAGHAPNLGRTKQSRLVHEKKLVDGSKLSARRVSNNTPVGGVIASFTPTGSMSSYRYVVNNQTKNKKLGRVAEASQSMGHWEARLAEEQASVAKNRELIAYLNVAYENAPNPSKFVKVSADSPNKQIRELHKIIPKSVKEAQRKVSKDGSDTFYVHPAEYNNVMGYRQKSVLDLWESDSTMAKLAVQAFEMLFGSKAASYVRRGELGLQQLVSTAKDFVVVRSVVVPFFNLVSNYASLNLRGIRTTDITTWGAEGLKAARLYKQVSSELIRLRNKVEGNPNQSDFSRIAELEATLANNPIIDLVNAGLMPTVVEDLSEHNDLFTNPDGLMGKLERLVEPLPQTVKDIGKEALITKGSKIYGVMNEATEMGDFVSKYIYYKHLMEVKGLNQTEAMQKAGDEFIDYGALSGRTMDYLNSVGLVHFFKYFLRIQSVLLSIIRENPSRFLLMLGAGQMGAGLTTPFDGAVWNTDLGFKSGWFDMLNWFFTHPLVAMLP